jgi:hypothetical protein
MSEISVDSLLTSGKSVQGEFAMLAARGPKGTVHLILRVRGRGNIHNVGHWTGDPLLTYQQLEDATSALAARLAEFLVTTVGMQLTLPVD